LPAEGSFGIPVEALKQGAVALQLTENCAAKGLLMNSLVDPPEPTSLK
jgi:hypothetical protein